MGLVLASASPRRRSLLASAGVVVAAVRPMDVDESQHPGEDPVAYARRLARDKMAAAIDAVHWVLAADTIVQLGGDVLGKPVDLDDARAILGRLQGTTHLVTTAWALAPPREGGGEPASGHTTTGVTFRALDRADIDAYLALGESMDKAGAYGAQAHGVTLIERIDGCLTTVIGLPVPPVIAALRSRGLA
jgi:septum formation protein